MRAASRWERPDLVHLWDRIKGGDRIPGWAPGKAFEYLVIRAFELEGLRIRWPLVVTHPQRFGPVEQLDGVVYLDNRAFIIESKDQSEPASVEPIARLRFRLEGRPPGTMGIVFSVSDFTETAELFTQFASPLNVLLWTSAELDSALRDGSMAAGLRSKMFYAYEHGLPFLP